jgi:hypothetical protein
MRAARGSERSFAVAAALRVRDVQREPVTRGCVLRSTLAGDRLLCAAVPSSTSSSRASGRRDREWSLCPHPRATVSCHRSGMRPVGVPSMESQGGGGTRGRRDHSRSPRREHEERGVEATASRMRWQCPASEARRTRVPPATCRNGARRRGPPMSPKDRESPHGPPQRLIANGCMRPRTSLSRPSCAGIDRVARPRRPETCRYS